MLNFKGILTENLEGSTQMYKLPQQEASVESVKWQIYIYIYMQDICGFMAVLGHSHLLSRE